MSNPWGIKLKKTGLNEKRIMDDQSGIYSLENRQNEMARNLQADMEKKSMYDERQASLASDAMAGQQERLGVGGKRRRTRRRNRKVRKTRKSKSRRYRKH